MLVWLDADANRKGKANENLAREMLELFTLGIGHYTEADVQAAARALTGWAIVDGRFGIRDARHDRDTKTLLGKTGPLTGDDVLAAVIKHPATARRITERLCRTFVGEAKVTDAELDSFAHALQDHDLNIGWAVETLLRSRLFFSDASLHQRVAGPVEWAVGAVRALELTNPPPSTLLLAEWTTRMGQELFYPPNVGGWMEGRAWLGSQATIARANFAAALVEGRMWHPNRQTDLPKMVNHYRPTNDLEESVAWTADLLWGKADPAAIAQVVSAAGLSAAGARLTTAIALLLARPEAQLC
jgi:uncharacterized protein (DUF1800 family)